MKPEVTISQLFPGYRIRTLDQLALAVLLKRSIVTKGRNVGGHQGRQPASWVFNLSGHMLQRWLHEGMFLYKTKAEALAEPLTVIYIKSE